MELMAEACWVHFQLYNELTLFGPRAGLSQEHLHLGGFLRLGARSAMGDRRHTSTLHGGHGPSVTLHTRLSFGNDARSILAS